MNIWAILGIDKTTDESEIKKAYRQKLKVTRPDDDEQAFMELRKAYEDALEYAENNVYDEDLYDEDFFDEDLDDDNVEYEESEIDKERAKNRALLEEWSDALWSFVNDKEKISNRYAMYKFLSESIAYNLKFYDECKKIVKGMCLLGGKIYLSQEVWNELDKFFKLSTDDRLIGVADNKAQTREINTIIKCNYEVDYSAFGQGEVKDIQGFIKAYVDFMEDVIKDKLSKRWQSRLDSFEAEYIPYECIKLALCFDKLTTEEIVEKIAFLIQKYGECTYTNLLNAQFNMYVGNYNIAEEILMDIYKKMDTKNYYLTYQLAICFKKLGRLYEGYLLIKHLTWLKPDNNWVDMAQAMYKEMDEKYDENASDMEHILMARLRIRTYKFRKTAIKALLNVKNSSEYEWAYNITKTFAMLEIYEGANAKENIAILDGYDKASLTPIDRLEYEEIKARMLFEAGKYEECTDKCNELLTEYPNAYPLRILRAYADKESNLREYYDLLWLNDIMSNRPDAALLLAYEMALLERKSDFQDAVSYLEKFSDLCEGEYRYYKALVFNDNIVEQVAEFVSLCEYIRDNEVGMPDAMLGDRGIALSNLYSKTIEVIDGFSTYNLAESEKYFKVMETIENTKYNNFSKYQDVVYLNIKSGKANKTKIDADSIDYEAFYKDKPSTSNRLLVQTIRLQRNYEEFEKVMARIDYDRLSKNGLFGLSGEFAEYYLMKQDGKNALKWAQKRIDLLKELGNLYLYRYQLLFQIYAECITDPKELKKAIKLFNELTGIYGKYSDDFRECYIYVYISKIYVKLGNIKKALATIDDMRKYSKNKSARLNYHFYIHEIYSATEDYEKAYEHLLLYEAEKNDNYEGVREFEYLWKMGKFSEASDLLLSLDYVVGDGKDSDYRIVAAHSRFFENMEFDMDNLKETYEVTIKNMEEYDEARNGDNYVAMAEVCYYLGKLDEYEKYMQLIEEFDWPSTLEKIKYSYRMETWKYIFKGEYQKAYEYLLSVDSVIVDDHFELSTLKYLLKQMVVKG